MGFFTRDAPWIKGVFRPSRAPAVRQPDAVSDDVQLTQDYFAGGQVQQAQDYLRQDEQLNPGPGARLTVLSPVSFVQVEEVWRIFFMSVRPLTGPTSNLFFDLELFWPNTAQEVTIADGEVLPAGINNAINVGVNQALILPAAPDSPFSVNIRLLQTSGPAASDVTLQTSFYILRNLRGIPHYL